MTTTSSTQNQNRPNSKNSKTSSPSRTNNQAFTNQPASLQNSLPSINEDNRILWNRRIVDPRTIRKKRKEIQPVNIPPGFTAHHSLDNDHHYGALILTKDGIPCQKLNCSTNNTAVVQLFSGPSSILLISSYCRPSSPIAISELSQHILANKHLIKNSILSKDSNAKNPIWNSATLDNHGRSLESISLQHQLDLANVKKVN